MTGGEEDPTRCFSLADDMTGSRSAEDAILANDKFLDTIRSTNLCNQLNDFGIPETSISSNDQDGSLSTLWNGEKDRCGE